METQNINEAEAQRRANKMTPLECDARGPAGGGAGPSSFAADAAPPNVTTPFAKAVG